jgi:hypothetical protein
MICRTLVHPTSNFHAPQRENFEPVSDQVREHTAARLQTTMSIQACTQAMGPGREPRVSISGLSSRLLFDSSILPLLEAVHDAPVPADLRAHSGSGRGGR